MTNTIAALILTFNEEKHIARCIQSLKNSCKEIIVVDSFSTDRTYEIAVSMGATVYQHKWINYAIQLNWGLAKCPEYIDWIWRIDADEYVESSLATKVKGLLPTIDNDVNGIIVNKKNIFMGRPLLHGGWYPQRQLKIIRRGYGTCEDTWMDEHMVLYSGKTITVEGDQIDENLNDLTWWTQKHNGYATREAINMLIFKYSMQQTTETVAARFFGTDAERKRWLKMRYINMPLFIRPFLNFFVRYVLWGGFLDGVPGLVWHVLQGFWYRFLVDAKIYEIKKCFDGDEEKIKQYIQENYFVLINKYL